jgi:hypothetical protein
LQKILQSSLGAVATGLLSGHGFDLVYASRDAAKFRWAQGFFSRTFDSNTPVDTGKLARYF